MLRGRKKGLDSIFFGTKMPFVSETILDGYRCDQTVPETMSWHWLGVKPSCSRPRVTTTHAPRRCSARPTITRSFRTRVLPTSSQRALGRRASYTGITSVTATVASAASLRHRYDGVDHAILTARHAHGIKTRELKLSRWYGRIRNGHAPAPTHSSPSATGSSSRMSMQVCSPWLHMHTCQHERHLKLTQFVPRSRQHAYHQRDGGPTQSILHRSEKLGCLVQVFRHVGPPLRERMAKLVNFGKQRSYGLGVCDAGQIFAQMGFGDAVH